VGKSRYTIRALATAIALVTAGVASSAAADPGQAQLAPLRAGGPQAAADRYIVVLRPQAATVADGATAERAATQRGGKVVAEYSRVLNGFAATLSASALAAVRAHPSVAYVQRDSIIRGDGAPAAGASAATSVVQPNPPSWGMDRVDQRNRPLDASYSYDSTGAGVTAYIVDSGIRASHVDFGGRAQGVYDAVGDGNGTNDCHGHGTHVAGTVGGATYGIAKSVQIRAVRVLQCDNSGWESDLIEGMDWIAANRAPRSVANFSLQGYGPAASEAAESLINTGVQTVFIANNFNGDACFNAPRSPRGITVGATDINDARASFSSFGPCVDVFAPGVNITSAGNFSDTASAPGWSGTSMAAPHVTGWVARYMEEFPSATLAQSKSALIASSTKDVLTDVGAGSPNRLLFADPTAGGADTAPPSRPGRPAASNITTTSVRLRWSGSIDNVGVVGYDVYREAGAVDVVVASPTGTSATITGLARSTRYTFYVRARDAAGNVSTPSQTRTITTRS